MPNFTYRAKRSGSRKYEVETTEVLRYCSYLENRNDHKVRYANHSQDEKIWRLEKYTLEELNLGGVAVDARLWPSFTSNGPRTYWNAIRRATTSNPPRMRIRLPGMTDDLDAGLYEEMLRETELHENFAYGAWNSVDELRVKRGELPFQDQLAWFMGVRGGVFMRPWIDDDSRYPFQVPLWDPATVSYDVGMEGLEYVCHHYREQYQSAATRFGIYEKEERDQLPKDEDGNLEIYDVWWIEYDRRGEPHVWNAVLCRDGKPLKDPYEFRELDHLPVYLIRSFGAKVETEASYRVPGQQTADEWETIYTANRNIYPWINRILTLQALYLRNNAIGPWFAKDTGFTDEQLKTALRPFNLLQSRNPQASITSLVPPPMSEQVNEFQQYLSGAEQRGGVPNSIFGQIPFELSGFAVNQLQGAVSITAGQMAKMMGFAYRLGTDELIQQFRARGRKVTVRGRDTRNQQFIEDIRRASLRDKYFLEVEMSPELPTDKLQNAQIAKTWMEMGIDPMTTLDEVLKIASPREVLKRMTAWGLLQQELTGKVNEASGVLPPPAILPPEAAGLPTSEFSPSAQHIPAEALAAAGFTPGGM